MKQRYTHLLWKSTLVTLLGCITYLPSFAQPEEKTSHFELGFSVGPSTFLGDLGGNMGKGGPFLKDNNFPMYKLMYGAYIAYFPSDLLGFRFMVNKGMLEGDDAVIRGKGGYEEARKIRNSNFRSPITEAMVLAEVYPTALLGLDEESILMKLRPYGMLGVGVFHFNPQGTDPLTGEWVDLRPLHTEGQGFPEYPERKMYSLTQLNIPMGIGVKYFLSDNVNLSLEILHRKTNTDYIDDVSTTYINPALFYKYLPLAQAQLAERMANKTGGAASNGVRFKPGDKRGDPNNKDAYFSVNVKLGFRLGSSNPWTRSTRCPIRF